MEARDRIVLALDVDTKEKAISLVKELAGYVGVFKVGMQLYNSVGPDIVKEINGEVPEQIRKADGKKKNTPTKKGESGLILPF
jgi:orotidine-5'-phosphate decarboxylase